MVKISMYKEKGALLVIWRTPKEKLIGEYFHNGILKQKALHKRDMDIVGLAGSADECIELVEKITANVFEATGSYDIYQYMMQEQA